MLEIQNLEPKQAEILMLTQVRKHLGNSGALQKLGFKVNVEVCRLSESAGVEIKSHTNAPAAIVKELTVDRAKPFYQLRAEHELEVQSKVGTVPLEEQHEAFLKGMRNNYIYPKGGYTKVELVSPVNGKKYVGECHFSINTIFNRKQASARAFGKLYSKLLADSSMGVKRGKSVISALV